MENENRKIKSEVKRVEEGTMKLVKNMEAKCEKVEGENITITERLRSSIVDKEHFKKLYEDSFVEIGEVRGRLERVEKNNMKLQDNLDSAELELDWLKEELLGYKLCESEKEEMTRMRKEELESKAKIAKLNENLAKIKK